MRFIILIVTFVCIFSSCKNTIESNENGEPVEWIIEKTHCNGEVDVYISNKEPSLRSEDYIYFYDKETGRKIYFVLDLKVYQK